MTDLSIITIVFNGMPFIKLHHPIFCASKTNWSWHVVEGPALPKHCTSWCRPQPTGHSTDGTLEYIRELSRHDHRVLVYSKPAWMGKIEMMNAPLVNIREQSVLLEVDCDELWRADQLDTLVRLFTTYPQKKRAYFWSIYFVGPDIVTITPNAYGNNEWEWLRAWRFEPGMRFQRHEPPVLDGNKGEYFSREDTRLNGLTFNHMAYVTREQVAYKEKFYGYAGAVQQWEALQANTEWPVQLKKFLPWVDDRAMAMKRS